MRSRVALACSPTALAAQVVALSRLEPRAPMPTAATPLRAGSGGG
ncbi:hypothetical protein [Marinobacterium aestuariivivens]|uniref:Uncharacterized protein n=1 Tax=Marinobacterium aestuariivivens TaxID=1698799 RepID=A0ABW2A4C5_9GAMM